MCSKILKLDISVNDRTGEISEAFILQKMSDWIREHAIKHASCDTERH